MSDIAKLKELAEQAVKARANWIAEGMLRQLFHSSATPEAVLELITEIERLRSIESFEDAVACVFDNLKWSAANTDDRDFDERLEDFAEDVIECAPRYKKQWKDIIKLEREKDSLKAENEALRKDAERYRWLRENNHHAHVQVMESDGTMPFLYSEELDYSVDVAMALEKQA